MSPLGGPCTWMDSDSLPLASSTGAAPLRAPVAYGEDLKCLVSGRELGDSFLPDKTADSDDCTFSELSPTQSHSAAAPYLNLHQPGSHGKLHPDNYLRVHLTQFMGPPKLVTVAFPYEGLS